MANDQVRVVDKNDEPWDFGAMLIESLTEALAYHRGEVTGLRVTRLTTRQADVAPAPNYDAETIVGIRHRLGLSQALFARALNVRPKTVQNWEQGARVPDSAARRLLQIVEAQPAVFTRVTGLPRPAADQERAQMQRHAQAAARTRRRHKAERSSSATPAPALLVEGGE